MAPYLAAIDSLDSQLAELETAVSQLDVHSKVLGQPISQPEYIVWLHARCTAHRIIHSCASFVVRCNGTAGEQFKHLYK